MPNLRWLDLRSPGVDLAALRSFGPAVESGRLGPCSILVEEDLAQRMSDCASLAGAMRLDASEDAMSSWTRAELEVRSNGSVLIRTNLGNCERARSR